jgi:hypothetical protein
MADHATNDPDRRRFELDVRGERETAALRLGAALLVVLASLWLLALPYPRLRLFSVAGFAFAALWLVRAARSRARTRLHAEHYLELGPDALRLCESDLVQVVPWPDVLSVEVDEDRLTVRVTRSGGPPLELEPRYRGLGVHALGRAVHEAMQKARKR